MSNVQSVAVFEEGRAGFTGKTSDIYLISSDGGTTNKEEVVIWTGIILSTFASSRAIFYLAPDGTAWSQSDLDSWEPGMRATLGSDNGPWRDTTLHCEAMGCDYITN